jgi:hypothetical protein
LQAAADQLSGVLPDQRTCHLDAGYDSGPTRQTLSGLGFAGQIAHKGAPAPLQAGRRWPVERTHSWMNGYGKLRRMTDRDATIVRYLPLPGRRVRHRACTHPARPPPLPLGHPAHNQAAQMTPIAGRSKTIKFLVRDRDSKFTAVFDAVFHVAHIRILRSPVQAPVRTRSWSGGSADAGGSCSTAP